MNDLPESSKVKSNGRLGVIIESYQARIASYATELEASRVWQRPFILLYELQSIYLYVFGLTDDTEQAEKEKLRERLAPNPAQEIQLCKDDFRSYLSQCKKIRFSYAILSAPYFLMLFLMTAVSAKLLPAPFDRRWMHQYLTARQIFMDPRAIRDLALNIRPMILVWMLMAPPTALLMIISHSLNSCYRAICKKEAEDKVSGYECLRLPQFIDARARSANIDFFHSPAFPMVTLSIFLLGVPASILSWIYFQMNLDSVFGNISRNPEFKFVISQVQFYVSPLGWCLATLFFRSYFTFGWNFTSREHDIEIYDDQVKSLPIKGWFRDAVLLRLEHIPCQIAWKDVVSITHHSSALPSNELTNLPSILSPLVKLFGIIQSVGKQFDLQSDTIEIKTNAASINIRLADLSKEQKAQLFCCLRKHAPSIHLDEKTQSALVGSSVLREPKYTEIWFDVLTSDNKELCSPLESGMQLRSGAYRVTSRVGSGGQAVVFLADHKSGNKVVLKEYQLVPGESLEVLMESARAFENESKLLAQLSHDKIVKLNEIFYENSRVYLVLEHVEGSNLRELIETDGPLAEAQVLNLAMQMCEILRYLHALIPPIVHRDFTPDNLILMPDGKLKLIDFSVAQSEKNLRSGECAGKHSYSPPEQFRGEASTQSDIYAIGATLFFLLVGEDPEPISMASPGKHISGISKKLNQLIEQATKLSLQERFESVNWLESELKEIMQIAPGEVAEQILSVSKPASIDNGVVDLENEPEAISLKEQETV